MATNFEWVKLILDKWAVILPALLFLGSALGWTFDNMEKTQEIEDTQKQVAAVANYYNPPEEPKKIIVKQKCNCKKLLNIHLKREH